MESSRRDLSHDVAEQRPILKNDQNMYHLLFGFTLKTGVAFPKTDILYFCDCTSHIEDDGIPAYNKRLPFKIPDLTFIFFFEKRESTTRCREELSKNYS